MNEHTQCVEKSPHQFKILSIVYQVPPMDQTWANILSLLIVVVRIKTPSKKCVQQAMNYLFSSKSSTPPVMLPPSVFPLQSYSFSLPSTSNFLYLTLRSPPYATAIPSSLLVLPPGNPPSLYFPPQLVLLPQALPLQSPLPYLSHPPLPPSRLLFRQAIRLPGEHQTNGTRMWCGQRSGHGARDESVLIVG